MENVSTMEPNDLPKIVGPEIRDFDTLAKAISVKKATKFWVQGESILVDWIKQRYVKKKGLTNLKISQTTDSAIWKHIAAGIW